MSFLNNFSIKSKMLFIVFIPLSILIMASLWKIDELNNRISDLATIEANLDAGNKVMAHLLIADKLRLNILKGKGISSNKSLLKQAIRNYTEIIALSDALMSNHKVTNQEDVLLSFTSSFSDMNQSFTDIDDFNSDDIDEWSAWIIEDIVFELLNSLEKLNVDSNFDEINQKIKVVNQLRWIMLYALQENWFIQVMLERDSFDELDQLRGISVREEIFVGRFLALNANEQQIELLLATFQNEDFEQSRLYKENMLASNMSYFSDLQQNRVERVLNNRLALMMEMSQGIIQETNKEIKTNIIFVTQAIYCLMAVIITLIVLVTLLGFNLINRIFNYLKSTLTQLEKIEQDHDYSIQISETGRDEFSYFSCKLNLLIAERKISEGEMLQAKEDAERANKAKSYFLANMSHEIRTPLNGILGMHQILSTTELSHSQKNHLETINQSSKTLLMLINDILDVSKIESGKLSLLESSTHFREALYETLSMLSSKALEKRLKLSIQIDPELPTYLVLDEHRLRQIVMNLLSNALKFTESGEVILSVSGERKADRCLLTIAVQDTGIGIAKESQQSIFKPFVQEDGSITREFGGTGLGLAISAQLVQLMGGTVRCDSEKGKGSCFSFEIDLAVDESKDQSKDEEVVVADKVVVIAVHASKAAIIASELHYLGVEVIEQAPTVHNISVVLPPLMPILYCYSDLVTTRRDLRVLADSCPKNPIIMIQETDDEVFDFKDQIAGQIMIPLLGKRCLHKIKYAVSNHVANKAIEHNAVHHHVATPTVNNVKPLATPEEKNVEPSGEERLKILLVEDNLVNQKVASFFLNLFNYDFEIADNGLIAVDKIKNGGDFCLILMDCMMPVMDGYTATEEIRRIEKEKGLAKLPIIALTANVFDDDIKRCYAVGMNDYLAKPINKEAFESKMKQYTESQVD